MFVACSPLLCSFSFGLSSLCSILPMIRLSKTWTMSPPLPSLMFTDGSTSIILGVNIHTYKIRTHNAHVSLHIQSPEFMNSWYSGMGHFIFWVCISMSHHISRAHSGAHKYFSIMTSKIDWLLYTWRSHTQIYTHIRTLVQAHTHTHAQALLLQVVASEGEIVIVGIADLLAQDPRYMQGFKGRGGVSWDPPPGNSQRLILGEVTTSIHTAKTG